MTSLEAHEKVEFESGPLIAGSVLVGVGGLLAFIGLVIGGLHAVSQAAPLVGQPGKPADGRGQDQVVTIPGRRCGRSQRMERLDPVGSSPLKFR